MIVVILRSCCQQEFIISPFVAQPQDVMLSIFLHIYGGQTERQSSFKDVGKQKLETTQLMSLILLFTQKKKKRKGKDLDGLFCTHFLDLEVNIQGTAEAKFISWSAPFAEANRSCVRLVDNFIITRSIKQS